MITTNTARELERQGNWREAASQWSILNNKDAEKACITIAESVDKGNQFRAELESLVHFGCSCPDCNRIRREVYKKYYK